MDFDAGDASLVFCSVALATVACVDPLSPAGWLLVGWLLPPPHALSISVSAKIKVLFILVQLLLSYLCYK